MTLHFTLTVNDGEETSAPATVIVQVDNVNHAPIAHATATPPTVNEGTSVQLDGSSSSDPDSDTLTYTWVQVSGTPVGLTNAAGAMPTFTAPQQSSHAQEALIFELTVSDGLAMDQTQVTVTVLDIDAPPRCDLAQASPGLLWPPIHTLVPVQLIGITDPDNDQVTLEVTGVTQDEPVNGLGDGDTSPDAIRQGSTVALRAERAGTGNGRVYYVTFTATDAWGGSCTGTVTVCMPRSRQAACLDDGQRYDATMP
jgi:REJ domain.